MIEMQNVVEAVRETAQIRKLSLLAREIWTEHYTPMIGTAQVEYMLSKFQSEKAIAAQIKAGCRYYLIRRGEKTAGYFAFEPKKEGEIFLSKIYVRASDRGQGIGKEALDFVENWGRENDFTFVTLTVNKKNTPSLRFYKRMGFFVTEALIQNIGEGFVMDDYRLIKRLA